MLTIALAWSFAAATSSPSGLADTIEQRLDGFRGTAGVYVRHLTSGEEVTVRADETFPTASLIKVPILIGVFDRIEKGELDYSGEYTYDAGRWSRGGEDLIARMKDGARVTLSKLTLLMITTSDNSASVWCQDLAGTGVAVNEWLDRHDFSRTRVNSRTPGREDAYREWGWGQTTPREMAELLIGIRRGAFVSPAASEEMYRHLTRIYWDGEALSQLPPTVQVASKQGAINRSRSEVALVNAPGGDYVISVITKDQEDERWETDNEGFVLLRDLSRICWEHFEPDFRWRPAEGMRRYW